eukprot:s3063_g7.t1
MAGNRATCAESGEACTGVPTAVCTMCDRDHLLCRACIAKGRIFSEVQRTGMEGFVEITGYNNENGHFVRFNSPLRFHSSEVPKAPDGTFNLEELMQFVELGRRPREKIGPVPS